MLVDWLPDNTNDGLLGLGGNAAVDDGVLWNEVTKSFSQPSPSSPVSLTACAKHPQCHLLAAVCSSVQARLHSDAYGPVHGPHTIMYTDHALLVSHAVETKLHGARSCQQMPLAVAW